MSATSPENTTLVNQPCCVKLTDIPKIGELRNVSDNGIFEDSSVLEVDNPSILASVNDLYGDDTEMTEKFETSDSGGSFTDDAGVVTETLSSIIETVCSSSTFGNNLENAEMKENVNVGEKNEESGNSELGQANDSSLSGNVSYAYRLTVGEAINCPVKKTTSVKGVKKALAMRSRAPEMVFESLKDLEKKNGATFDEIISHIEEKYGLHAVVIKRQISQYLEKGEKRGDIVKIIGVDKGVRFKIKQMENFE